MDTLVVPYKDITTLTMVAGNGGSIRNWKLPGDSRYPGLAAIAAGLKPGLAKKVWNVRIC